jgi:hypothetical protein
MKTEVVDVKSNKKIVAAGISVPIFEALTEAVSHFEADNPGEGEKKVLEKINAQVKADICNAERVKALRGPNPMKQLKDRAKKDPAAAEKLNALLRELDLEGEFKVE